MLKVDNKITLNIKDNQLIPDFSLKTRLDSAYESWDLSQLVSVTRTSGEKKVTLGFTDQSSIEVMASQSEYDRLVALVPEDDAEQTPASRPVKSGRPLNKQECDSIIALRLSRAILTRKRSMLFLLLMIVQQIQLYLDKYSYPTAFIIAVDVLTVISAIFVAYTVARHTKLKNGQLSDKDESAYYQRITSAS